MRNSIYTCPHCGEKSFNPLTKAVAGGLKSRGKVCKECGLRCVNGKASTIFHAVVYLLAFAVILYTYLKIYSDWSIVIICGTIAAAFVICLLFDAFVGRLVPTIRRDA